MDQRSSFKIYNQVLLKPKITSSDSSVSDSTLHSLWLIWSKSSPKKKDKSHTNGPVMGQVPSVLSKAMMIPLKEVLR